MSYSFETVKGFFLQDNGYDSPVAIPPKFGLNDECGGWNALLTTLEEMNTSAPSNVAYKLVFAARHGQAYHNFAELKYGTKIWNDQWAKLDGDGEITWGPDPPLTDLGERQAVDAHSMWEKERRSGMPLPEKLYCSPMTRALRTCELTFGGIIDFAQCQPVILENCREIYGVHSCDQRSSLAHIHSMFPAFAIEQGFTEDDELHDPSVRESHEHVKQRAKLVLEYIFNHDNEIVISITAHSRFIKGLAGAACHEPVHLPTGGVLPIIVKCTKLGS